MEIKVRANRIKREDFVIDRQMPFYGHNWDRTKMVKVEPVFHDTEKFSHVVHYFQAIHVSANDNFQRSTIERKVYFPANGNGDAFMEVLNNFDTPVSEDDFVLFVGKVKAELGI